MAASTQDRRHHFLSTQTRVVDLLLQFESRQIREGRPDGAYAAKGKVPRLWTVA